MGTRARHRSPGAGPQARRNPNPDPVKARRGRTNAQRGKAIQRKRIEGLGGRNLSGNNENLDGIGTMFAYESKSGGSFSERYWRWIRGIPTRGDQVPVLIVTDTPARAIGHARSSSSAMTTGATSTASSGRTRHDMELTHASFFSGVGGLDLGLERAGWRTVSVSEIDPYACAVLAERWPGVPNLGDIVQLAGSGRGGPDDGAGDQRAARDEPDGWTAATLWTGGFPCQDLSVAGKRAGLGIDHGVQRDQRPRDGRHDPSDAGRPSEHDANGDGGPVLSTVTRSGLAFAFLDLVERHRPPAVLLENVPGLLSSHAGRDLGALLGRLGQLGYGWAYRILDAQWFGVPQRRRRVFILAIDLGLDPSGFGPAEVLAVGTRCGRDHAAEREAWARAAGGTGRGAVGTLNAEMSTVHNGQNDHAGFLVVGAPPDADGVRAPDGLAGRLDGGEVVATTEDDETWRTDAVSPTLNAFDVGDTRATTLVAGTVGPSPDPDGLDSNRYRVVGNGVVAPVAEWLGLRLADYFRALP